MRAKVRRRGEGASLPAKSTTGRATATRGARGPGFRHRGSNACAPELQPALWGNIVLVGGSVQFPGFKERLEKELRTKAPDDCELNVVIPENPVTQAWQGGAVLAEMSTFDQFVVTKQEYTEFGDELCRRRFMC